MIPNNMKDVDERKMKSSSSNLLNVSYCCLGITDTTRGTFVYNDAATNERTVIKAFVNN